MSGTLWALTAGFGFGMFQSLNRRSVHGMDVYLATFLQLLISAAVLLMITLISGDINLWQSAPPAALINFALAGLCHFFVGWTFLNAGQKLIGASRTSPLIGTTPLFGAIFATFTLGEFPSLFTWMGILIIVLGVFLVSKQTIAGTSLVLASTGGTSELNAGALLPGKRDSWLGVAFGLSAALFWSISPIFIRRGLQDLASPLFGVTVGLLASSVFYAVFLLLRRQRGASISTATRDALFFKLLAGVVVGLSTWMRWIALDFTTVANVLALSMISTPVVLVVSPLLMERQLERVTRPLVAGAGLIIGGALFLIYLN